MRRNTMDLPDIVNMYFDADSCNDTDALSETLDRKSVV